MTDNERSEEQWLVHAINIQGMFFEGWVADTLRRREYWSVAATGLPVSVPRGTSTQESELDVLAERDGDELRLTLFIECKKHNPDYAQWVFFKSGAVTVRPERVEQDCRSGQPPAPC